MSVARQGANVFVASWLGYAVQIVTSIVVIRTLGAGAKGVLVLLTTSVALVAMAMQLGFPAAGVFLLKRGRYTARILVIHHCVYVVIVTTLVALLMSAGVPAFSRVFLDGAVVSTEIVIASIAAFPFALSYGFTSTLMLASRRSAEYAWLLVSTSLATLLITVALVAGLKLGLFGALLGVLIPQGLAACIAIFFMVRDDTGPIAITLGVFRHLMRFGVGHYVGTIGSQMFKRLDSFLLAYFLNPVAVGYYSVALTTYEGLLSIPRAFSTIASGEAASREPSEAATFVARATRILTGVMLIAAPLTGLAAYWVVPLLYGADFSAAVMPLQILAGASIGVGVAIILQAYFLGVGSVHIGGLLTLGAGIGNFILSILLIPKFGIVGSAVATAAAALVMALTHAIWFRRFSGIAIHNALIMQKGDRLDLRALGRSLGARGPQQANFRLGSEPIRQK